MSQGPKSKTVEETQTAPRDQERNDQTDGGTVDTDATATETGATTETDPEKIVDQMSHADNPSNDSRNDDPRV